MWLDAVVDCYPYFFAARLNHTVPFVVPLLLQSPNYRRYTLSCLNVSFVVLPNLV